MEMTNIKLRKKEKINEVERELRKRKKEKCGRERIKKRKKNPS